MVQTQAEWSSRWSSENGARERCGASVGGGPRIWHSERRIGVARVSTKEDPGVHGVGVGTMHVSLVQAMAVRCARGW